MNIYTHMLQSDLFNALPFECVSDNAVELTDLTTRLADWTDYTKRAGWINRPNGLRDCTTRLSEMKF